VNDYNLYYIDDDALDPPIAFTLMVVAWMELAILIVFSLEILMKIYAYGFLQYFDDNWLRFDGIVIVVSIIMIVLSDNLQDANFTTVSKALRGIFRFLRLFLVFRKVLLLHTNPIV
jgi:hypothetical protein